MKRLSILAFLLTATLTSATAARVQAVAADTGTGATSLAINIASSGAGNTLIVLCWGTAGPSGVADNKPQTYTQDFASAANGITKTAHSFANSAAGATTITVSYASSTVAICFALEYSGMLTGGVFDKNSTPRHQTGVTSWASNATATTAQANEVWLGAAGSISGSSQSFAASGSWAAVTGTGITAGHHGDTGDGDDMFVEEQIVSATGVVTATGTCSSSTVDSWVVTYKAASSSSGVRKRVGAIWR